MVYFFLCAIGNSATNIEAGGHGFKYLLSIFFAKIPQHEYRGRGQGLIFIIHIYYIMFCLIKDTLWAPRLLMVVCGSEAGVCLWRTGLGVTNKSRTNIKNVKRYLCCMHQAYTAS